MAAVVEIDGVKAWQTRPNRHSDNRYLYFDADYTFLYDGDETLTVVVEYLDSGVGQFGLEYDSADPTVTGIKQYFRRAGSRQLGGTGKWQKSRFELPRAHFAGRANGGDFRFWSTTPDMTIRRVIVARSQD